MLRVTVAASLLQASEVREVAAAAAAGACVADAVLACNIDAAWPPGVRHMGAGRSKAART